MGKKKVNLFISHSWNISGHHSILSEWLFEEHHQAIQFMNQSVPLDGSDYEIFQMAKLKEVINTKMAAADILVLPTGMYSACGDWIQREIDAAKSLNKAILVVNPWPQEQKNSVVKKVAQKIVGWDKDEIIDGILSLS